MIALPRVRSRERVLTVIVMPRAPRSGLNSLGRHRADMRRLTRVLTARARRRKNHHDGGCWRYPAAT